MAPAKALECEAAVHDHSDQTTQSLSSNLADISVLPSTRPTPPRKSKLSDHTDVEESIQHTAEAVRDLHLDSVQNSSKNETAGSMDADIADDDNSSRFILITHAI